MNRTGVLVFVGMAALAIGMLAVRERESGVHVPLTPATATASATATVAPAPAPQASDDVGDGSGGATGVGGAAELELAIGGMGGAPEIPELTDAPKSVKFGVIFVTYMGAELAPDDARSKADAQAKANELAAKAREDFAAAVKEGDPGSVTDAGRMFRDVVEQPAEYALFSLEKGEVSDPVDTPRGFWILKRLD